MAAPMTDIHLKHVIELGLKTIRANPDHHLKDIFGDSKLDPHAALYGNRTIEQAKNWIMKTKVPVILGFDTVQSELPLVTVHLSGSAPSTPVIGDYGLDEAEELEAQQKEVLVPKFTPASLEFNEDKSTAILTLPENMPFAQKELFLPGLKVRDPKGREYFISMDKDSNLILTTATQDAPLAEIEYTSLEVVSPVIEARYTRGAMVYDESATIVVHGHSTRQEGLWLYYIVMWSLLKFRPILTGTFGLDLGMPSASDYSKDDQFLGEQVWRRYISINCKTIWTWEAARQKDILGLLLTVQNDRVGN